MFLKRSSFAVWAISAACALVSCGCTSLRDYVGNGFKVGPQYETPTAPVAGYWIDADDIRLRGETGDLSSWWSVFDDPMLNNIMVDAYQQNLTVREAGFRVLAARAQYGIAVGNLFPQQQDMGGGYTRRAVQNIYNENWNMGFNLAWELDFWGRFRRSIIAAEDTLDASVFNYDDVIVTLLGDVASTYVQIRTLQRRIELLENVIAVQQDVYNFIDLRLREGFTGVTELDKAQAESDLKQSRASVAQLRIDLRTNENALCALLGRPSVDLEPWLALGPKRGIPIPPDYAVVGIPADLLRRRPDVRRAERNAAAQAEQIGVATSDLYPAFSVSGSLGWQNSQLDQLVKPGSFTGFVGPQSSGTCSTTAACSTTFACKMPSSTHLWPSIRTPSSMRAPKPKTAWSRSSWLRTALACLANRSTRPIGLSPLSWRSTKPDCKASISIDTPSFSSRSSRSKTSGPHRRGRLARA